MHMPAVTLDISEARRQFTKLDERLREERLIWVTRHGKEAFAVVDVELMQAVLETLEILRDPEAFKMLEQSLEDVRAGRLYDHEDVKREILDEEEAGNDPVDKNRERASKTSSKKGKRRPAQQG